MAKHHLMALTNAVPGKEAEMNRWYDEQHLPDVLRINGVISAQRYCIPAGFEGPFQWRYVTLYALDTDDLAGVMERLGKSFGSAEMPATDAMDLGTAGATFLQELGGRVTAATPSAAR